MYISTNVNKTLKYTETNLYIFISQIVTIVIIIIIYITHLLIVSILHIYKQLMQTKYISLIYVCVFYSYDCTFFYFSTYPKL